MTENSDQSEFKKDILVYVGIVCLIGFIVFISHLHLKLLGITMIVTVALAEALLVGYYFMHLMTKKKTIHLVLFLTFVIFLFLLIWPAWDIADSPRVPSPYVTN